MNKAPLSSFILLSFFVTSVIGPLPAYALDELRLPVPGVMVRLSPPQDPPILKGIKVHPDNPLRFEFILDKGDMGAGDIRQESAKLIKYFLASLTIPEKDLWVNLSPYEKDRIIPKSFGLTEMGRDLLAEDYMLKQITASLVYPEDETGKKFWKRVYEEAARKYGTTNVPVNTFNKVWIVPEKAVVFENAQAGTAYVVESKLKVMLEEDYLSLQKHKQNNTHSLASQVIRDIVIPELTKEVNEGKNFSHLRQVYNSLILATWYKKKIKDSILEQVYADENKVKGVGYDKSILSEAKDLNKPKDSSVASLPQNDTELIYQRYLQAFKKGVYNYIKEEQDPLTQATIPRKYFSGGMDLTLSVSNYGLKAAFQTTHNAAMISDSTRQNTIVVNVKVEEFFNQIGREVPEKFRVEDIPVTDKQWKTVEQSIASIETALNDLDNSYKDIWGEEWNGFQHLFTQTFGFAPDSIDAANKGNRPRVESLDEIRDALVGFADMLYTASDYHKGNAYFKNWADKKFEIYKQQNERDRRIFNSYYQAIMFIKHGGYTPQLAQRFKNIKAIFDRSIERINKIRSQVRRSPQLAFSQAMTTGRNNKKGFTPVPYNNDENSKTLLKWISVGIAITGVIGMLFHYMKVTPIPQAPPAPAPVKEEFAIIPNITPWPSNKEPAPLIVKSSRSSQISDQDRARWKALTDQQRQEYRKKVLSAFFWQVLYHLASGDWQQKQTGYEIADYLKGYYDPAFVDIITDDEWVSDRTPYSAVRFMDFMTRERGQEDPDKRAAIDASFQAVYTMLGQNNRIGGLIDVGGIVDLLHFGYTLGYPDNNGDLPNLDSITQKLQDAQTGLGKLMGGPEAYSSLDLTTSTKYMLDYIQHTDFLQESIGALNKYLGKDFTAQVLQNYDEYRSISLFNSNPSTEALVRNDPQGFIDTVTKLHNYFDWETIQGLVRNANEFKYVRDLSQDVGDRFGSLVDLVNARYGTVTPVLADIQFERMSGMSNDEIWRAMDAKYGHTSKAMISGFNLDTAMISAPLFVNTQVFASSLGGSAASFLHFIGLPSFDQVGSVQETQLQAGLFRLDFELKNKRVITIYMKTDAHGRSITDEYPNAVELHKRGVYPAVKLLLYNNKSVMMVAGIPPEASPGKSSKYGHPNQANSAQFADKAMGARAFLDGYNLMVDGYSRPTPLRRENGWDEPSRQEFVNMLNQALLQFPNQDAVLAGASAYQLEYAFRQVGRLEGDGMSADIKAWAKHLNLAAAAVMVQKWVIQAGPAWGMRPSLLNPLQEAFAKEFNGDEGQRRLLLTIGSAQNFRELIDNESNHRFGFGFYSSENQPLASGTINIDSPQQRKQLKNLAAVLTSLSAKRSSEILFQRLNDFLRQHGQDQLLSGLDVQPWDMLIETVTKRLDLDQAMITSDAQRIHYAKGLLSSLTYKVTMGWTEWRGERLDAVVQNILESPDADGILSEIPFGSKYLGVGDTALALETPRGNVIRIGQDSAGRMKLKGLLQPLAKPRFIGKFRIELLPKVQLGGIQDADVIRLERLFNSQGYRISDTTFGKWDNLGRLPDGEVVVFDPEAIKPLMPEEKSPLLEKFNEKGGIDFTANKTPLEIRTGSPTKTFGDDSGRGAFGDDSGIRFKLNPAILQQLKDAPGFVPVIIGIQPLTDLRLFLGLSHESAKMS